MSEFTMQINKTGDEKQGENSFAKWLIISLKENFEMKKSLQARG